MKYDPMKLPNMLKAAREKKGLTQEAVAEAVGLTYSGYGKIERGVNGIGIDLVYPLCDFLEIPRIEAADAILPLFEDEVMKFGADDRTIRLEVPETWYQADADFMPDHVVKPRLLVSQEELEFGLLLSRFIGLPLMHPIVFKAFLEAVQAHAWASVMCRPDGDAAAGEEA